MREFSRVLCTGGAGFLGSAFVRWASDNHPRWNIRVLDKLTYAASRSNLSVCEEKIDFMVGDVCDESSAMRACDGVDAVIHFAAESHVDRSLLNPHVFVKTNIEGTLMMLAAAQKAGVKRFLQVSSDEVYGDLTRQSKLSVETDCRNPSSPYAASKAAAEHLVAAYHRTYGLDVVITRGANTYGSHQYPEKIVPLFIANAILDKPLPVYGNGDAVRDYLHVHDHVRGIDTVLHEGKNGEAYNLGAGYSMSALQVAEDILLHLGKPKTLLKLVKDRQGHDYRYAMDCLKAHTLGWRPTWTFADGIKDTCDWYVRNQHWWRQAVDPVCGFE